MAEHLVNHHNGKQCSYCDKVHQETRLTNHIQQAHQPRKYVYCNEEFPACDIFNHSQTVHSAKICPYCHYFGSDSDIEQHISQCHIRCKGCTGRYTAPQLRTHRREVYSWMDCPDCEVQYPPTQFVKHAKDHRLLQCPFPSCIGSPTMDALATHIQCKHSTASCPFCDACTEDLGAHILNHLFEYDQNGPCPDCGERCEEVHFYAHVLSHRVRPRHSSSARSIDSAKAGKDFTLQQVEKHFKNFLRHYQDQATPWLRKQQEFEIAHADPSQGTADHDAHEDRDGTSAPDSKKAPCKRCGEKRDRSNMSKHLRRCKGPSLGNDDETPPLKRRRI
ncbi:hypothetical protein F5Y16DRAFT_152936 [Xylariaceae sp. FL0255]|nr:hypothetical protein F5Y16DRAFT_152936 [Xylariaceae sp. FL0255]